MEAKILRIEEVKVQEIRMNRILELEVIWTARNHLEMTRQKEMVMITGILIFIVIG